MHGYFVKSYHAQKIVILQQEKLQRPFLLIISYDNCICNNEYLLQFHYIFIAKSQL